MEQLMLGMLAWLGAHSDYKIPPYLPAVEYKTAEEISDIRYRSIPKKDRPEVLALFEKKKGEYGTIYLNKNFDQTDKEQHMILLHELVHFLQIANKARFACTDAMEPEAYNLTILWLKEHGLPNPFDDAAVLISGLCYGP